MHILLFGLLILFTATTAAAGSREDPELRCLAKNIYHEARGESLDGQVAVGIVTLNRVKSERYPNSICEVVYQPSQFSWTIDKPKIHNWKLYHKIKELADLLIDNHAISEVDDAMYYHADRVYDDQLQVWKRLRPWWAKYKTRVTQIDNHIFYRANTQASN